MVKLFKLLMAVVLVSCTIPASAQFTGGGGKTGKSTTSAVADTNPYNRISLSYDNTHLSANDKLEGYFNDEDAVSLNGAGLEYIHGFSVSKSLPMFVETGIKVQFGMGSVSDEIKEYVEGYKVEYDDVLKCQFFSFSVPVNYTYRFTVGENMILAPYLGLNFKVHGLGRFKGERKFDNDELQEVWDEYKDDDEKWMNVFDKKDMGDKDATWNRFQMGWQIGLGLNVKAFYVGLQYGTDFIPAYKHKKCAINTGNLAVKIGYNF